MRHVSYSEFKGPDGKIDWAAHRLAYEEARKLDVDDGVLCETCGTYLIFAKGHRQQCGQCKQLGDPGELIHDRFVRCPACGVTVGPSDANSSGRHGLFEDGDHTVFCNACDHEFMVNTQVSYAFTSPARLDRANERKPHERNPRRA